ncbi:MAG TPA: hypothetical protein VGL00_10890 [Terracidiphilus sp.]|jgi:hypothetical protein
MSPAVTESLPVTDPARPAKPPFGVDPQEEIVAVFMSQFMISFDWPEKDFQVLAYAAMEDQY